MEITNFLHVIEYSIYAEAMFDMSTNWRANWSYDPTRRGHWSVESPVVASRNVSTFFIDNRTGGMQGTFSSRIRATVQGYVWYLLLNVSYLCSWFITYISYCLYQWILVTCHTKQIKSSTFVLSKSTVTFANLGQIIPTSCKTLVKCFIPY